MHFRCIFVASEGISKLPPSYSLEEYKTALRFFLGNQSIKVDEIRSHLQGSDHELQQEHINSVIQNVIEKLESLRLIEKDGDLITLSLDQTEKITDLYSQIDFIKKSKERKIWWTWYYFYSEKEYVFSVQKIKKYNPTLNEKEIEKILDTKIIPQCEHKGINFKRDGNNYVIGRDQNIRLIRGYITGILDSYSRSRSQDLEWNILDLLDKSPYSNSDLVEILGVDKSVISRKIKHLRRRQICNTCESPTSVGRLYWLTNCDNCPWSYTKEQCRDKSIRSLIEICKKRYDLDLDPSYFDDIDYNQTLVHLVDLFKEIPNRNPYETEKRVYLDRIFHDIINKTSIRKY